MYGPETTQRQIFDGTTKALVKDVLGGENSLVFTYGVTNAGKTFTFLGETVFTVLFAYTQLFCIEDAQCLFPLIFKALKVMEEFCPGH